MTFKKPDRLLIIFCLIVNVIFAQSTIRLSNIINTGTRGYINNPAWSIDSNLLAFEFKPTDSPSKIMILDVISEISAVDLFAKTVSTSSLLISIENESMRLPQWSHLDNNTLYLLHSADRSRLLSKISNIRTKNLPLNMSLLKKLDKTIKQSSQIVEYYPYIIGGEEYIFIKQQNTPGMIDYTDQYGQLEQFSHLRRVIEKSEQIDSFSFSRLSSKFLLCKGQDNQKQIILGKIKIQEEDFESVEYEIVDVDKLPMDALQEPSFSPISDDLIAFLELSKNSQGMTSYELKIHSLKNKKSYHITNNIYRNEENKTSQPLSTSYAWHTTQHIIFFIDKLLNRTIAYADISDLNNPIVKELSPKLEYVENICLSPDGKYLAAITSSSSSQVREDALNQIHLIKPKTK